MQVAIEHALIVLSWHENLPEDEVPPEYLWDDSEGLEQWWATVKEKRERDSPNAGGDRQDVPDPDGHPDGGMAENTYADALRQR